MLSARAGTPIAEIETLVANSGQELAFEPLDYGPLLGIKQRAAGTIGGVLAGNLAGPRRLKAGAARDHVLGIKAVSGRGEAFKSGGRVVKNVTGYDLSKVMAGSWGTLAVLTEVTLQGAARRRDRDDPRPARPARRCGHVGHGAGHGLVRRKCRPPRICPRRWRSASPAACSAGSRDAAAAGRFWPVGRLSRQRLKDLLGAGRTIDEISGEDARRVWRDIRDCIPFADGTDSPVWRVSMAPMQAHRMVLGLRMEMAVEAFYDWQGGLVWLRLDGPPAAEEVRRAIRTFGGGHATLVRASETQRTALPVFEPQPQALAGLAARLKEQFDPKNILNPGRMA